MVGGPGSSQPYVAVVFNAGTGQVWIPPAGVTQILDIYCWGAGGNAGGQHGGLGGGGGGGGGFANAGKLTADPGQPWTVNVDAAGGGASSSVVSAAAVTVVAASSGSTPAHDAAGAAGAGTTGVVQESGGAGAAATALVGVGGGGGGAAGAFAAGSAGVGSAGGAGGGAAVLLGEGVGGTGGIGGAAAVSGTNGTSPGAGGGGGGTGAAASGNGAAGLVVIFYALPISQQAISLSHRADVSPGQGPLNYIPGQPYPTIITDEEIGDSIGLPWWAVSAIAGGLMQIVEYSYADECGWEA